MQMARSFKTILAEMENSWRLAMTTGVRPPPMNLSNRFPSSYLLGPGSDDRERKRRRRYDSDASDDEDGEEVEKNLRNWKRTGMKG
jgi:hypothetical protein